MASATFHKIMNACTASWKEYLRAVLSKRPRSSTRLRYQFTRMRIRYTTFMRGASKWLSGFHTRFMRSSGTSTSLHAQFKATRLLTPPITTTHALPDIPELDKKTSWGWNVGEVCCVNATAFWLGWADGYAKRESLSNDLRRLNLGAMFDYSFYDFGLLIGEHGVMAEFAMRCLVQRCNDEAVEQSKGDW